MPHSWRWAAVAVALLVVGAGLGFPVPLRLAHIILDFALFFGAAVVICFITVAVGVMVGW